MYYCCVDGLSFCSLFCPGPFSKKSKCDFGPWHIEKLYISTLSKKYNHLSWNITCVYWGQRRSKYIVAQINPILGGGVNLSPA